jgi:hypothetical protein
MKEKTKAGRPFDKSRIRISTSVSVPHPVLAR